MSVKEKISRIPWREFLSKQLIKILGLGFIALLLVITMIFSNDLNLEVLLTDDYSNTNYLIVIIFSSIAYFFVVIGFTKIILFDMAKEFGLRDDTGDMVFNLRFWLFAKLNVSFCSSIYILLGVQLENTYLVILPVLLMRTFLESIDLDFRIRPSGSIETTFLSELSGRDYYQTVRNFYFDFFFIIIIGFSIIVFLSILTTFARRKIIKRFRKEEEDEEIEKQGIRTIYKLFLWILIPPFVYSVNHIQNTSPRANEAVTPFILIVSLLVFVWWVYQALKVIFLIVWRGTKITAFITIVNLLVIIPLIGILWLLPVFILSVEDVVTLVTQSASTFTMGEIISKFISAFIKWIRDFPSLIQMDFIIITSLATLVVGFAEGFAIIVIITALFRGVDVTRTGEFLPRSPPKIVVFSKYLFMFGIWLSLLWNSFVEIFMMLVNSLDLNLEFELPDFFTIVYKNVVEPISVWLAANWDILEELPLLLFPIIIIFSGAFKFLSVTLITPRVEERGEYFFLLISTAFVLIVTNILGYIHELGISDAPFQSIEGASELLSNAVITFAEVEALSFFSGFFFGIGLVFWKIIHWRSQV